MNRLGWLAACSALCFVIACGDDDGNGNGDRDGGRDAGPGDGGGAGMDGSTSDAGEDAGMSSMAARGEYLVQHVAVCGDCHTPRNQDGSFDESRLLSGVECFVDAAPDDPDTGCLSASNLTNHETGLANHSDREIKDMFLKGERPDGTALHPFMPYYALGNMREGDADAIVAYLRELPGVDHTLPPNQPPFTAPDEPVPTWPQAEIPMPSDDYEEREAALRGRYLAGEIGICMECHTPRADDDSVLFDMAFQGGNAFPRELLGLPPIFPDVIYSSNITPHETGIAGSSVDDIVRALKQGEDPDQGGAPICPPMPSGPMGPFGGLTDGDARDIAHYLLSIPPGDNAVPEDCLPMMPPDGDAGTEDAG